MSGEGEGKAVCVTGASGYIASWLVKCLLLRGYTVKATVRDPNDSKKTEHLLALDGAKERLHLLKANLLEKGSFDSVVEECIGVFHTASPLNFSAVNPQTDMVDPAVKGTLNVLESCTKVPSIKRVVLTSSIASVIFNGKPLTPDTLVDETWFSDAGYCEKIKNWYFVSKTLAEDAAIRFAETNGIDLVVLNPGVVIGPLLQPTLNFSVEVILNLVNGIPVPIHYPLVDVRDIAYAHIYAFEVPTANGRNLLVNQVIRSCEILEILRQNYPTLDLPQKYKNEEEEVIYQVSKEKAKSLGIEFMSLEGRSYLYFTICAHLNVLESVCESSFNQESSSNIFHGFGLFKGKATESRHYGR